MSFKIAIKKGTVEVTSKLATDTYGKYLTKFLEEIKGTIAADQLVAIMTPLLDSKSWRLLNRETRRACDQYCTDNNIMDHAAYQAKYFYEGTMIGRTMYGKDAPWADGKAQEKKPTFKEKSTSPVVPTKTPTKKAEIDYADQVRVSITHPSASNKKAVMEVYDLKNEWDRVNYGIAKRIAADEGWPMPKAING